MTDLPIRVHNLGQRYHIGGVRQRYSSGMHAGAPDLCPGRALGSECDGKK